MASTATHTNSSIMAASYSFSSSRTKLDELDERFGPGSQRP